MNLVIETPRLHFRPFQASDAEIVYPWMTDEEIQRYMPTGRDHTMEQVEARVARYMAHQEKYGYSRWLMFDRASGEAIGDAGILHIPASGENEVGYRVIKPWWGKGIATEATAGWLNYAFEEIKLPEVIAFSHPDNVGSVRVMQKNGFEFLREDNIAGMGVVVYILRKP